MSARPLGTESIPLILDQTTSKHLPQRVRDPWCDTNTADVTLLGEHTTHRSVRVTAAHQSPWLQGMPECAVLQEYDIIHLGVVAAMKPYRFIRRNLSATTFLACFGGEGRVLIDGKWMHCPPRSAALLPPHTTTGYYAVGTEPWSLVWICYQRGDARAPLATVSSPVLSAYDPNPLRHAVEGLQYECAAANDPVTVRHFVDLIHRLVIRFAEPWQREDRLHLVWERVAADLAADWTLDRLAHCANCSAEHLRRLCQRQFGRSPAQHVTHLRLRRATHLLIATDWKLEVIAAEIGYSDPFAFSAMFKKWIGCPPSKYRQQRAFGGNDVAKRPTHTASRRVSISKL